MAAETNERVTPSFGEYPRIGTYPVAADEEIVKGCMVAHTGSYAVDYSDDGNGYTIVGVARAGVDNRTTAPSGGGAGALDCDVRFGVFEFAYSGSAPAPRAIVYGVDNQTVSTTATSAVSGYRGVAGIVIQTNSTAGTCRVFMGGWMQDVRAYAALVTALAAEVGDYTGGGGAEADVATGVVALETDALSAQAFLPIPLNSIRLATGAALPAYSDGVDGLTLQDSEAFGIRFNDGVHTAMAVSVPMPPDLDATADVVIHALGFRIGAADADAALAVGAFFQTVAAAHTADADAGGNTTAFDAATTVVSEETVTIAAADVPAAPCGLTLTLQSHTTLDADDMVLVGLWLEYTRALRTS